MALIHSFVQSFIHSFIHLSREKYCISKRAVCDCEEGKLERHCRAEVQLDTSRAAPETASL